MQRFLVLAGVICLWACNCQPTLAAESDSFIAHEWGTFTTLQDDDGRELPGINIDDEPVPGFVHNLAPLLLNKPVLSSEHWIYRQKGAPRQHPMVTMRLETPVIYFYPGRDGTLPRQVDVDVRFRGGWLTEFFPYAKAEVPGLINQFEFGPLTPQTVGRLTWNQVRLDTRAAGPETDAPVWLAPRQVKAVDISVAGTGANDEPRTESERYLFYRGVANQRAPLRVATEREGDKLLIRANFDDVLPATDKATIRAAWLVDIRAEGQAAFRALPAFEVTANTTDVVASTSRRFSAGDYDSGNFRQLRQEMHKALVADGLYDDEATAMLATWERAYFQTAGMRLFFLVPRVWTDHYLPLSITGDPRVERVMMGRIEVITAAQRERLAQVAASESNARWMEKIAEGPAKQKFLAGRSDFGDLGVDIPENYQAYLALGRFRNALVVAEAERQPSSGLQAFLKAYGIRPYRWEE